MKSADTNLVLVNNDPSQNSALVGDKIVVNDLTFAPVDFPVGPYVHSGQDSSRRAGVLVEISEKEQNHTGNTLALPSIHPSVSSESS
jgi:translation elongation factor EF-Ts